MLAFKLEPESVVRSGLQLAVVNKVSNYNYWFAHYWASNHLNTLTT